MKTELRLESLRVSDIMTPKPAVIPSDALLSDALGQMRKYGVHELPVVENKKFVGLISYETLIRRRNLPLSTHIKHLMSYTHSLSKDDRITKVAELLLSTDHRALPVTDRKELIGLVSRIDLIKVIPRIRELADIPLETIMSRAPICVNENDTILKARELMHSLVEQSVPVVDQNGRLRGVVGLKDIAPLLFITRTKETKGEVAGEKSRADVQIKSVLSEPVTLAPNASVGQAVALMLKHNISTIIVTDEQKIPVGVVGQIDLVELIARFREREELYVQLTGLEEEDTAVYEGIYAIIQKSVRRFSKLMEPQLLIMHVTRHSVHHDSRIKYSIRARLSTTKRMFYASSFDWDIFKATDNTMRELERMIRRQKERAIDAKKRPEAKLAKALVEIGY